MDFGVSCAADKRTPISGLRPASGRHPVASSSLRIRQFYRVIQAPIMRSCRSRTPRSEATPPQLQKSQLSKQAVNVIRVSPFVSLVVVPASAGVVAGYIGTVVADLADLGGPFTLAIGILFAAAAGGLNATSIIWQERYKERRRSITVTFMDGKAVILSVGSIIAGCGDSLSKLAPFLSKRLQLNSTQRVTVKAILTSGIEVDLRDQTEAGTSLADFLREIDTVCIQSSE